MRGAGSYVCAGPRLVSVRGAGSYVCAGPRLVSVRGAGSYMHAGPRLVSVRGAGSYVCAGRRFVVRASASVCEVGSLLRALAAGVSRCGGVRRLGVPVCR
ncbi:thiovarsolin family RiPP [Nonomuraea pusilla]|uniref:thiovarsolin family RiPP n=1 Tax=Nonomuraea pusilla TaxID=46177 RepID=UPI003B5ADA5B